MRNEEVSHYLERSFNIDCPRMVLRKSKDSSGRTYEGPGSIYQTTDGRLMFKLYANERIRLEEIAFGTGTGSAKAGEIIPAKEYYSLEGFPVSGPAWGGQFILPDFSYGDSGYGPVVTGALYELTQTRALQSVGKHGWALNLTFPESFDFPGNSALSTKTFLNNVETSIAIDRTPSVFQSCGIEFYLRKDQGTVRLSARLDGVMPPQYADMRICEALQFVFFRPMPWIIRTVDREGVTTTSLRPFPQNESRNPPRPPIGFSGRMTGKQVWHLFNKYFEHIISAPNEKWHPLSENIYLVALGDDRPLDAGLLALARGVEGVLKVGFPKLAAPDDALRKQIKEACALISKSPLNPNFKKRLLGSVKAMLASRAKDKLLALEKSGMIRRELIEAWECIRHPTVHGEGLDRTAIDKMYRDYQSALTLFNELVFLIIGYVGQYTDYSVPDWPLRNFEKPLNGIGVDPGPCAPPTE